MKYSKNKAGTCFIEGLKHFLIISVLYSFSTLACATDYYVDGISGADGYDGKSTIAPWLTIDKARRSQGPVEPGDTVYIRGGTISYTAYTANAFVGSADSGVSGSPITYKAYPGETVTLHATSTCGRIFSLYNDVSFITFDGFTFTDTQPQTQMCRPVSLSGAHNITIQNCTFSTTFFGIECSNSALSTNITVSGNIFFGNSAPFYLNWADGVVIKDNIFRYTEEGIKLNPHQVGRYVYNIDIEGNFFYQGGFGWEHPNGTIYPYKSSSVLVISQAPNDGVTGVKIFNNIFWGNSDSGIRTQRSDTRIYNNVFYRNGYPDSSGLQTDSTVIGAGAGIKIEGGVHIAEIKNNIFYGNISSINTTGSGGGTYSESYNLLATDPLFINGDPEAVDPCDTNNYMLSSNSPAKDKGCQDPSLTDVVKSDFRGYSRADDSNLNIYDIGAFEHGAVPSAPTGLTIM